MKMTTFLREMKSVVREFKEKNPGKSLADLEVRTSNDEEGNSFFSNLEIAWTNDARTEVTIYPTDSGDGGSF